MKLLIIVVTFSAISACAADSPQSQQPPVERQAAIPTGCKPHIEIHGAAFWARELGESEMQVLANHRINLWEGPAPNKGQKVGELRVGSRAQILEESANDYRVQSPLDKSIGWISKIQVARTLHQDTATREPCEPR